jgi:DNA-binding NarL/FixJ family response regulator
VLRGIQYPRDPEDAKIRSITKREREVIHLIGQGLKNAAIGQRLFISEATVRNHLTSILSKLDVSDKFELVIYAFRHGLITINTREPRQFRPVWLASGASMRARETGT